MFKLTPIAITLFITTAVNFIAAYISWQRKKTTAGSYFALGMIGITCWTLAAGFDYAAVPIPSKVFFAKFEYTAYNIAFASFAYFSLSYAGYDEWLDKNHTRTILLIIPISNILLAWTNDWHGWLWSGFERSDFGANTVIFEHGPGYIWAVISGYLMILTILVPMWQASRRGSDYARRQARILLYASFIPIIGNLVYLFEAPQFKGVDWSSITFSISSLLILLALYGMRLLDLVPIARDRLISSLSDGMIVLDIQDRVIDINQAAAYMFETQPMALIGKDLVALAPLTRSFLQQPIEQEIRTELHAGAVHKRYFDVLLTPLRDSPKNIIGRLIIFRDITERKENELRLLQLTQGIEQSPASVVITDLIGNITYVNPQFAALTGYSQDEVIGKNPNIIKSGQTPDIVYREMWRTIQSGQVWRGELLNKKKNGELYWEFEVIAPVLNREGHIINFIAVKDDITERKQVEEALERRFLEIQKLHRELLETQTQLVEQQRSLAKMEERQRLGRDMHDSVNQSIHSLMLFAETLTSLLQKNQTQGAIDLAKRIHESGEQALKEIRLLVYENQPLLVNRETDLIDALEERLNMVERRVGMWAEVVCGNEGMVYLPLEWKENLYWMIVEALNNALKHAKARSIKVDIRCTEKQLEVKVEDNGAGFETSQVRSGGFGMRTMRERAEILGGELSVESSPGHGTLVCFKAKIGA